MESSRDGYSRHTRHEDSDYLHERTGLKDSEVGQEKLQRDAEEQENNCLECMHYMAAEGGGLPIMAEENNKVADVEIKVLFFARALDLAGGVSEMKLQVPSGSTAQDCLGKIFTKYPELEEIHECMVLALNLEYTPESVVVNDKDELAIIPPISGG